jgi:hypothetical protein
MLRALSKARYSILSKMLRQNENMFIRSYAGLENSTELRNSKIIEAVDAAYLSIFPPPQVIVTFPQLSDDIDCNVFDTQQVRQKPCRTHCA